MWYTYIYMYIYIYTFNFGDSFILEASFLWINFVLAWHDVSISMYKYIVNTMDGHLWTKTIYPYLFECRSWVSKCWVLTIRLDQKNASIRKGTPLERWNWLVSQSFGWWLFGWNLPEFALKEIHFTWFQRWISSGVGMKIILSVDQVNFVISWWF